MENNSSEIIKRLRAALRPWASHIEEKRMFGGTCFLYNGKMSVGEIKERLMVRVQEHRMNDVLRSPYAKPMDFTGKIMKEFVFVQKDGFKTEEQLQSWVELGIEHAKFKSL